MIFSGSFQSFQLLMAQRTQVVYPDGKTVNVLIPTPQGSVWNEMHSMRNGEDSLDRLLEYGYRRINFLCQSAYPGFKLNKNLPGPPGPPPESPPPPIFVHTKKSDVTRKF
ncbi:unnamed protein product [Bursaphelenchus okinawaensis]|uniref:Uncharacterized protein n=1 Tax=Bursaphelenchus okinawaensis TaxID=465554 RepID=A0A811L2Z6_9BILA|nr:unnamed protein product [Bursaphelenchus okinawaensis]CAG9115669.1 unnamed protein product [Bursaphelenchus okinawaensis]